ncbi:MAG: hypothetical protein M0P71_07315 [Melioribacteraceae bacterium]|jgi:hypothetical protein|nr:hypothetical protein [Melioribacteraceae bacterium]
MENELDLNKSDLIQDDIQTTEIPVDVVELTSEELEKIAKEKEAIKCDMISKSIAIEKLKIEIDKFAERMPELKIHFAGEIMKISKELDVLISTNQAIYEACKAEIEEAVLKVEHPVTIHDINVAKLKEKAERKAKAQEEYAKSLRIMEESYKKALATGKIPRNPSLESKIKSETEKFESKKNKKNKKSN